MSAFLRLAGVAAILLSMLSARATGAPDLPETRIAYDITVALDPATRMLTGREIIRWTNPSATPVASVPMHLYLNGFSHEGSSWMRSAGGRGSVDRLLDRYDDPWGWNEPGRIRQGEVDLEWAPIAPDDGNPFDRSLIEVTLAEPIGPGATLVLEVDFEAKLPVPIARTGGYEDFFFVAQWFPKVAVFETVGTRGATEDGWAAHQFHGPTEFYADYADFDVSIGVPPGWAIVATGKGGPADDRAAADGTDRAWHRYRQRAVHDFAFATGEKMVDVSSVHQPAGTGGPVEIHVFVPAGTEHQVPRWRRAVVGSLDVLGARVGPYPYETVTVVMPPWRAGAASGMEYPTLFTGLPGDPLMDFGPLAELRAAELTIAHEFCHQYFYGIVGTNEFEEAFLDEGFTEHWGTEAMIGTYGAAGGGGRIAGRDIDMDEFETFSLPAADTRLPPVWTEPSFLARGYGIGTQFYSRPATTLRTAEALFGRETMDRVFALYYERWAFGHPRFEDFLDAARTAGGDAVADFILEAFTTSRQPDYRVAFFDTKIWEPPRGRLVTEDGIVEVHPEDDDDEHPFAGLDPSAREPDGLLLAEIIDPGWTRAGRQQPGRLERRLLAPESGEPDEGWEADEDEEEDEFHVSRIRLQGPEWDHLPVDVWFRFADGVVVKETWDGRGPYRTYRFLRQAPLSEVRLDPERRILVDPDPVNNARSREPDDELVNDWSTWLGGLFQLMAEGMSQWM